MQSVSDAPEGLLDCCRPLLRRAEMNFAPIAIRRLREKGAFNPLSEITERIRVENQRERDGLQDARKLTAQAACSCRADGAFCHSGNWLWHVVIISCHEGYMTQLKHTPGTQSDICYNRGTALGFCTLIKLFLFFSFVFTVATLGKFVLP